MIGREYPSEMFSYGDPLTGKEVIQLTKGEHNNYHIYFTDNSFDITDKYIYFLSDRSSKQRRIFNFFKMDLQTGRMVQITDEPDGIDYHTKTPDSEIIVFVSKNVLKKCNTKTGEITTLYAETGNFKIESPFISPDKKYVGIVRNEIPKMERGGNYKGFKEQMFATKQSVITLVYLDGSKVFDIYEVNHMCRHFQFSPDDSTVAMFCHEGPWHLVHQRIWILDLVSRKAIPCFRQQEDDSVGHEFWTRDGLIFFDNRRKGHDGTITKDKTQAILKDTIPDHDQKPYVGLADRTGRVLKEIEMPYYCNHYHANSRNDILIGDDADNLVAIDCRGEKARLITICGHNTVWFDNRTHPHPTFSWNNQKILFASHKNDLIHLYLTEFDENSL